MDLVLTNSKVYIKGEVIEAGIAVDEGKIYRVAKETNLPVASRKLDLEGYLILPGLIDCHVHLRDQQLAYEEDFTTGTSAAAAGGITSVLDMPNNQPVTMSAQALRERIKLAEKKVMVNVAFFSAFPENLKEIPEIAKDGVVGFKVFLSQKIGGVDIDDDNALLKAFKIANKNGVPVAVHAEDKEMLETTLEEMQQKRHDNVDAYVRVHSPDSCAKAIKRVIHLTEKSSLHVHFCHISSTVELDALTKAKERGVPVTFEVVPHNLFLNFDHLKRIGNLALTNPPLRPKKETEALWNALQKGLVDIVASDHAPHLMEEKKVESVWDAKSGIPGVETTLPLLLTEVNKKHFSIADLVRTCSEKPAQVFHLESRGSIIEGNWADLTVVDLNREYRINSSRFCSKAKFSPFDGQKVKGKPVKTFVNGQLVFDEDTIVAKPSIGQVIR